jgi:hypothetical protein
MPSFVAAAAACSNVPANHVRRFRCRARNKRSCRPAGPLANCVEQSFILFGRVVCRLVRQFWEPRFLVWILVLDQASSIYRLIISDPRLRCRHYGPNYSREPVYGRPGSYPQSNEHALHNNNSRVRFTAYMIDALNGRNIGDFTGMQDFAAERL